MPLSCLQSAGQTASMTFLQFPQVPRVANLFPLLRLGLFFFIHGIIRRTEGSIHLGSLFIVLDKLYYSTQSTCIVKYSSAQALRHFHQQQSRASVTFLIIRGGMLVKFNRQKTTCYTGLQRRLSSIKAFDSRWPGWQIVIGIEVHAQIKSRLKLFSGLSCLQHSCR